VTDPPRVIHVIQHGIFELPSGEAGGGYAVCLCGNQYHSSGGRQASIDMLRTHLHELDYYDRNPAAKSGERK
jgi:hypothetical protein